MKKTTVRLKEALLLYEKHTGKKMLQSELASILFPTNTKNSASVRVNRIANGEPVSEELAKKISTILKVPYSWLVGKNN